MKWEKYGYFHRDKFQCSYISNDRRYIYMNDKTKYIMFYDVLHVWESTQGVYKSLSIKINGDRKRYRAKNGFHESDNILQK